MQKQVSCYWVKVPSKNSTCYFYSVLHHKFHLIYPLYSNNSNNFKYNNFYTTFHYSCSQIQHHKVAVVIFTFYVKNFFQGEEKLDVNVSLSECLFKQFFPGLIFLQSIHLDKVKIQISPEFRIIHLISLIQKFYSLI